MGSRSHEANKELRKYSGKWVVRSSDGGKIVGSGAHPREALKEARSFGEKNPILEKVPKEPGAYILVFLR